MDAFEQIVKIVLEGQGWWVRQGYKVELTKEEKVVMGRYSSPRWEIDLLAYKPESDQILIVECKSFLDSFGVRASEFIDSEGPDQGPIQAVQRSQTPQTLWSTGYKLNSSEKVWSSRLQVSTSRWQSANSSRRQTERNFGAGSNPGGGS